MKNLMLICLSCILLSASCKKKDPTAVASLPEATQIGANTFGALANGSVLLPRHDPLRFKGADLLAYYSPVSTPTTVNFNIYGDDTASDPFRMVQLISKIPLQEGQTYPLQASTTNLVSANYYLDVSDTFNVTPPLNGQLTITKLDQTNRIISGTFYFDAISATGEKVSITDGRFDVKF